MRLILASIIILLSLSNSQAQEQGLSGSVANAVSRLVISTGNQDSDRQNLAKVSARWSKYWMAKQLDQVIELYAPDAVFLTGTGDRFTGKVAIRELFKTALETNTSNITVRSIVTELSGRLAYDSGDYRETITPISGAAKIELQGNYVIVFRFKNGQWLIIQHVWTDKIVNREKDESTGTRDGDAATRRHGDTATRRHGDTATRGGDFHLALEVIGRIIRDPTTRLSLKWKV